MHKTHNKYVVNTALVLTLIIILYGQFVLGHFSDCFYLEEGPNALGLTLGYGLEEVMSFIDLRTNLQLLCYIDFISVWDNIFPIIYGAAHILFFMYFFERWGYVIAIPILHMAADWIENWAEIGMIESYLDTTLIADELITLGSTMTIIKWSLSMITYGLIIYALIRATRGVWMKTQLL